MDLEFCLKGVFDSSIFAKFDVFFVNENLLLLDGVPLNGSNTLIELLIDFGSFIEFLAYSEPIKKDYECLVSSSEVSSSFNRLSKPIAVLFLACLVFGFETLPR